MFFHLYVKLGHQENEGAPPVCLKRGTAMDCSFCEDYLYLPSGYLLTTKPMPEKKRSSGAQLM